MTDWFTADTHFGHKNILGFEPTSRPYIDTDTMDWAIIRNINSVVMPNDTLFILGDIAFSSRHDMLDHINAQKIIIILGNHDYPNKVPGMMKPGIKVAGCLDYKKCILTHIPVHPTQLYRYRANIHGHLHSLFIPDKRYYNVGMERHEMMPIKWEDLAKRIPSLSAKMEEANG